MRLCVATQPLLDAVAWVARIFPTRPSSPDLNGVLLDSADGLLNIVGFHRERYSQAAVEAENLENHRLLVSARLLVEVIRDFDESSVELSSESDRLILRGGRARYALPLLDSGAFYSLPLPHLPHVGTITGSDFTSAVNRTLVAVNSHDPVPSLTGVRIGVSPVRLDFVATDRYRLAVARIPWQSRKGNKVTDMVVPACALRDIARSVEADHIIKVGYENDDIVDFQWGHRRMTARLLADQFPDYTKLFPREFVTTLIMNKENLVAVARRVGLFADTHSRVRLDIGTDAVRVRAANESRGEADETISAKVCGEQLTVAFNSRYLLDGLRSLTGPDVELCLSQASMGPSLLREPDMREAYYLLMPTRLPSL